MSERRPALPLVLVAVGVVLLLNPLYLYPGGPPAERTYGLRAEPAADLSDPLRRGQTGDRILHCSAGAGPHEHRACVFESLVGPNDTHVVPNRTLSDGDPLESSYAFVTFDGREGFYAPRATAENGSVVLSLDRMSARAAADELGVPTYRGAPDGVQRAIDSGNATVTVRFPGDYPHENRRSEALDRYVSPTLVEHNSTYYLVTTDRIAFTPDAFPPLLLGAVRVAGVVLGVGLVYAARRRQRTLTGA